MDGRVQLRYKCITNFGENFEFITKDLHGRGGSRFQHVGIDFRELVKCMLAIYKLQELGLLTNPSIPKVPPSKLINVWNKVEYVSIPELYKLSGVFHGFGAPYADAFLKYLSGDKLSEKDLKLLIKMQTLGSKMPALKTPSTKHVHEKFGFDKFAEAALSRR